MYEISISNQQSLLAIDEAWITGVVQRTLELERVHGAEVSISILDDAALHTINREHLQHDYPTDVISFLYDVQRSCAPAEPRTAPTGGLTLEGEILVSAEMARESSRRFGWNPQDELTLYLVHGLLHLCGYNDQTELERQIMRDRERDILKNWNLTPHYES